MLKIKKVPKLKRNRCVAIGTLLFVLSLRVAATDSPSLSAAPAGVYVIDPSHTSLLAIVRHMGLSNYTMRFDSVNGSYQFDPRNPYASRVEINVDANSIDVGNPKIGEQFAREFLAADTNPRITFTSTKIQATHANHINLEGNLTFRGITRVVRLDITYNGTALGLTGKQRMGFSGVARIKRSDFGSQTWQGSVGDDVELRIEVEFLRS